MAHVGALIGCSPTIVSPSGRPSRLVPHHFPSWPREETPAIANEIERKDLGCPGGNQDSCAAALDGLNDLERLKGGGTAARCIPITQADALAAVDLERLLAQARPSVDEVGAVDGVAPGSRDDPRHRGDVIRHGEEQVVAQGQDVGVRRQCGPHGAAVHPVHRDPRQRLDLHGDDSAAGQLCRLEARDPRADPAEEIR